MKLRRRRVETRRNRAVLGLTALLSMATACKSEPVPSKDNVRSLSQALSNAPEPSATEPPCSALGAAVTATTGKVIANSAAKVDAYDSSAGPYGAQNAMAGGTVRAATEIIDNGADITGNQVPHSPANFASIAVPSDALNLPLGSPVPGSVNINGTQDSITLAPGNYVVDWMNVNHPGELSIAPAGKVNIYVLGGLNLGGVENPGGDPKDLTFLVPNPGWVNVNSNGQLFGNIFAPQAAVNVNSTVFGSIVGSDVTLNSGAAVHFDQALRCPPPPIATTPPRPLPLPPKEKGCYLGTANGWQAVPCTTKDELSEAVAVPEPTIRSFANPSLIPLEYGEVDITFASFGELRDDGLNQDTLTVQANTNFIDRPDGGTGWVQFVVHAFRTEDPENDADSAVCIWDFVDASSPLDYFVTCVGGGTNRNDNSDLRHISRREGSFQQFDFATVGGSTFTVDGEKRLGMVARLSWFNPNDDPGNDRGLYSVVVEDHADLGGNWTDISGTVFSARSLGTAVFSDTSVVTRILAGSCATVPGVKPDIPWPGLCPTQPPLLPSTQLIETNSTGETSNLVVVGQPNALASITPDLVFTQFLSSDTGECQPGAERVYVKDHPSDTGVVPSNADGQPFWQSPDLFIVPAGAVVDVTAPAPPIVITPGEMYDAYMRVNNDYSCSDVTGVKARLHLADPSALSVAWSEITPGTEYQGPPAAPDGISVPAGGRALVGPFTFQAPASDIGDGHRCVLGSIISDNQPAPGNPFDPPGSYQVAQRNLSFAECIYPLTNATTTSGTLELTLSVEGGMPSLSGGNNIAMTFFDPAQTWYQAWLPGQGTAYSVTHLNGETTVRLGQASVPLAPVPLGSGVTILAEGSIDLTSEEVDTTLSLGAVLSGPDSSILVSNGGSCLGEASTTPPPPPVPR